MTKDEVLQKRKGKKPVKVVKQQTHIAQINVIEIVRTLPGMKIDILMKLVLNGKKRFEDVVLNGVPSKW